MRRFTVSIFVIHVLALTLWPAQILGQIHSTTGGGPWEDPATWVGGAAPGPTDDVVIATGAEVSFQSSIECNRLTVESGAALTNSTLHGLIVRESVLNMGTILGSAGLIDARGDVINEGVWEMRLYFGGSGPRTVQAPNVTGDQWVTGAVILESQNTMSRLDAFESQTGSLLIQEGASLSLSVAPMIGYTPAGIGFPDEPALENRGTIQVPNIPEQFNNSILGSDLIATLGSPASDTLWASTYSDQTHPSFANSVRKWYRFFWRGSSDPSRQSLTVLAINFDESQLNGLDPNNLFVYHSSDNGANWTRVTSSSFEVFFDPNSGQGSASLSGVPSEGDYTFSDDQGPTNAPPVAVGDFAYTIQSRSVLVDVIRNDYDPDGDAIQLVSAGNGSFGTTSIEGDQVRYTPSGGFVGDDSFNYVIVDNVSGEAGATVSVRVADPATLLFTQVGPEEPGPDDEVVRRRTASVNFEYLDALTATENGTLTLNLFDDVMVVLDQAGSKRWTDTEVSWFGRSDRSGDWLTLEFDATERQIFGTVWVDGLQYRIEHHRDGTYVINELDLSDLVDETDLERDPDTASGDPNIPVLEFWEIEGRADSNSGKLGVAIIDLLILFSPEARDSSGTQLSMRQEIFNAVNNTNATFRNSGVNAVVRLAGTALVSAQDPDSAHTLLDDLTAAGQLSGTDVFELRRRFGADIVGLVNGDILNACGRAHIMGEVSTAHADLAFFVVQQGNCLGGNLSFAHEIGHIMSARHDRFVDNTDGSPHDFNHGFVNPPASWNAAAEQWRTVMAYNDACTCSDETPTDGSNPPPGFSGVCPNENNEVTAGPSCTRVMGWSTPSVTWTGGNPMGIASGATAADNVRTLNLTADTVAAFFGTPSDPEYSVSGRITLSGQGLADVEIRGVPGSVTTDALGEFWVILPRDWPGTMTPYHEAYDFVPPSITFDTLRTDTTVTFVASLKRHTLAGSISTIVGDPVTGVAMEGLPGFVTTDALGNYSIVVDHGWAGEVRPTKPGFSFEPFSRTYVGISSDLDHDYDAYPGGLARSEWPMWGSSPLHRGLIDIATYTNSSRWTVAVNGRLNPPVIGQDGTIYVTTGLHLIAYDVAGSKLWEIPIPNDAPASPAVGTAGRIYVAAGSRLLAYNVFDQSQEWAHSTGAPIESAPTIDELGNVLFGSNTDSMYSVSPNGALRWGFQTAGDVRTSPAISEDGSIFFGSDDGFVYALAPNGSEIWRYDTGGPVRSSPTIGENGAIIVGTDADAILALDAATGNLRWRYEVGGDVRGTPALGTDGTVYIGSADSTFYALTPSGSLAWSYDVAGPISSSAAVSFTRVRKLTSLGTDEEVVYVSTDTRIVYAFNVRTPSGFTDRLRWQYIGASTSPVLTRAGLLVGDVFASTSRLVALDQESRALVQFTTLLNDFGGDFDPDLIAAILWLEEQGGPLALLPGIGGDPCTGGSLIIPNCPLVSEFDRTNPFALAEAGRELILGVVQWTQFLADVIAGTSTEGLLGTFPLTLNPDVVSSVVVGGLIDPSSYAPNPDGLATDLSVFQNSFSRDRLTDDRSVYVYSGNFSTDSPALDFTLSGNQALTFNGLGFGSISEPTPIPEGVYDLSLLVSGQGKASGKAVAQSTLDLSGRAGDMVALFATGFMDPAANGGGPPLGVLAASGSGDVLVGDPVGTEEPADLPDRLTLDAVYPNPFSVRAVVAYEVPRPQRIRMELFDILGRRVATLIDGDHEPGSRRFLLDGTALASGVYLLRLVSEDRTLSRKLTVIR